MNRAAPKHYDYQRHLLWWKMDLPNDSFVHKRAGHFPRPAGVVSGPLDWQALQRTTHTNKSGDIAWVMPRVRSL